MRLWALILSESLVLIAHCTLYTIVPKTVFSCKLRVMFGRRSLEDIVSRQLSKVVRVLWVLWKIFLGKGRCLLLWHELWLCIHILVLAQILCGRYLLVLLSLLVFVNQLLQRCLYCWSNLLLQAIQSNKIFDELFQIISLSDNDITSSIWTNNNGQIANYFCFLFDFFFNQSLSSIEHSLIFGCLIKLFLPAKLSHLEFNFFHF